MSDEHYPEFTSAQTERLDEIDNAVYQTILAFLNKSEDEFPWDMYYIGEVAECIEETLLSMGQRVHRPVIVTGKDGISRIEEYQDPPKPKIVPNSRQASQLETGQSLPCCSGCFCFKNCFHPAICTTSSCNAEESEIFICFL